MSANQLSVGKKASLRKRFSEQFVHSRSVLISMWRTYVYMLSVPPGVQAVYRQCTGTIEPVFIEGTY